VKPGLPRDGQPRWGYESPGHGSGLGLELEPGFGALEERERRRCPRNVVEKRTFCVGTRVVVGTVSPVCGRRKREEAMHLIPWCGRFCCKEWLEWVD